MRTLSIQWVIAALAASASAFAAPTDTQFQAINAARSEYQSAKAALEREDWETAAAALKRAERLDPDSADVQNLLGFASRKQGKLDSAVAHYFRALELNPSHRGAHEYLGRAYLYLGKPDEARGLLAKLETLCVTDKCPERDSLKQAIAEWDPWKRPARGGRSY